MKGLLQRVEALEDAGTKTLLVIFKDRTTDGRASFDGVDQAEGEDDRAFKARASAALRTRHQRAVVLWPVCRPRVL